MNIFSDKVLMLLLLIGSGLSIFGQLLSQIYLQKSLVQVKENVTAEISRIEQQYEMFNYSEVLEFMHMMKDNTKKVENTVNSKLNITQEVDYNDTSNTESQVIPQDCVEVYEMGGINSDVYTLQTPDGRNVSVFCDMDTDGGGWIVFQRRQDGSVLFNRTWNEYKNGFGNLDGEFWLGNDAISSLTSNGSFVLRVDLWSFNNETRYAEYEDFVLRDETDNYRLIIGNYAGTAGKTYGFNDTQFSTIDRDNDSLGGNCAKKYGGGGGFWYKKCAMTNLNSIYFQVEVKSTHGINWFPWLKRIVLKATEMKFRPEQFKKV